MKKIISAGLIVFLCGICGTVLRAQQPEIEAKLSNHKITIGGQVELSIKVKNPKEALILFPNASNTRLPENVDILGSQTDTLFTENKTIEAIQQTLIVTAFAEGTYTLDFFSIQYIPKNTPDSTYTLQVPATTLQVENIAVDTTKAIKDIKGVAKEPLTFKEIEPYIALGLGILTFIFAALYCLQRYRNKKPLFVFSPPKPPLPPHVEALQELEILRKEKLWQNGLEKEYYTQLTAILRTYLEKRFFFPAHEMTTDEMLDTLASLKNISSETVQLLQTVLPMADLVKFAKLKPQSQEHDFSFTNIKTFVEQTAEKEQEPSEINTDNND